MPAAPKHSAKLEAQTLATRVMGVPVDMEPDEALQFCINVTHGEIAYCDLQLEALVSQHDWYVSRVWSLTEEQAAEVAQDAAAWVEHPEKLQPQAARSEEVIFACRGCLKDYKHAAGTPCSRRTSTVGRNDPCPCGSGRKLKRCRHGRG